MQQKINNFLEKYLQIRLTRVHRPLSIQSSGAKKGNNLIVEFIGPSCVGKSTLYFEYLKTHNTSSDYSLIGGRSLRKKWDDISANITIHLDESRSELLSSYFLSMATNDLKGLTQYKRIWYLNRILLIDLWISECLNKKLIIFDEHLYNRLFNKQINSEKHHYFLQNRIFISCKADAAFHLKNIKARRSQKTHRSLAYGNLNEEETLRASKLDHQKISEKVNLLRSNGATVYELNMAKGIDHNTRQLDKILNRHAS